MTDQRSNNLPAKPGPSEYSSLDDAQPCRDSACSPSDERMERIYEYLDGALSIEDLDDVRDHLHGCPDCASDYDLECIIRSVVRRSCVERAPETLKLTIIERISQIRVRAGHQGADADPARLNEQGIS